MRFFLAFIALLGFVAAGLALREHYRTDNSPCSINERWDCGIVNHSPYAVIGPFPVAAIGIAGYVIIALLSLARQKWLLGLATMCGLGFSVYLTHIERNVLMVWCLYCVISLGIISALTLLSLIWAALGGKTRYRTGTA